MENAEQEPDYKALRKAIIEREKFEVKATFIPYSVSRNAKEKWQSLNWKITILRNGRAITKEFDYSQGVAHAPSYKKPPKEQDGKIDKHLQENLIWTQIETGTMGKPGWGDGTAYAGGAKIPPPSVEDVLWSCVLDAEVLDHESYEDWAGNFGYDPDSRKGHETYTYCMEAALVLRARLGEELLREIKEAWQDY